jgi:hypothetical protein
MKKDIPRINALGEPEISKAPNPIIRREMEISLQSLEEPYRICNPPFRRFPNPFYEDH